MGGGEGVGQDAPDLGGEVDVGVLLGLLGQGAQSLDAGRVAGEDQELVAQDLQADLAAVGHPGPVGGEFGEQGAGVVVAAGGEGEVGFQGGQVLAQGGGADQGEGGFGLLGAALCAGGVGGHLLQVEPAGGQAQPDPQDEVLLAVEPFEGVLQAGLGAGVVALAHADGGGGPHGLGEQCVRAVLDEGGQFVGVDAGLAGAAGLGLDGDEGQQGGGAVLHAEVLVQGDAVGLDGGVHGGGDLADGAQASGEAGQAAYAQFADVDLVAEGDEAGEAVAFGGVVALDAGGAGEEPQGLPAQYGAFVGLGGQGLAQGDDGVRGAGGGGEGEGVGQGAGGGFLEVGALQAQSAGEVADGPFGGLACAGFQAGEVAGGHALAGQRRLRQALGQPELFQAVSESGLSQHGRRPWGRGQGICREPAPSVGSAATGGQTFATASGPLSCGFRAGLLRSSSGPRPVRGRLSRIPAAAAAGALISPVSSALESTMRPSVCASRASSTPAAHTAAPAAVLRPTGTSRRERPDDDIGWPKR
ncbi:hypothetical protein SAVIM40S_06236 [Streptomyces avidinii]